MNTLSKCPLFPNSRSVPHSRLSSKYSPLPSQSILPKQGLYRPRSARKACVLDSILGTPSTKVCEFNITSTDAETLSVDEQLNQALQELRVIQAQLTSERSALRVERRRRLACEAELEILKRSSQCRDIWKAAAAGDLEVLRANGSSRDVNQGDYDKRTPMHLATSEGHLQAVMYLHDVLGAKLSPVDRWGNTPLDEAVKFGMSDVAKYLESKGAIHGAGFAVSTAAAFRTAAAADDVPTLKRLCACININAGNYEGRSAMHLAASGGRLAAVKCLIELGAELSPRDCMETTPLDAAMQQGHVEMIEYLQKHGAERGDVHKSSFKSQTAAAFRSAAFKGDLSKVQQLAPHTNINAGNDEQRTAMHLAASAGNLTTIELLIELGAGTSPLDSSGNTPLDNAKINSHEDVCALLEAHGAYLGASFRRLIQDGPHDSNGAVKEHGKQLFADSPSRSLAVPLSFGRGAASFAAVTSIGLVSIGGEFESEIEGAMFSEESPALGRLGPVVVGTYSCHGAEPDSIGGTAGKTNQDCACVASPIGGDECSALFCVFDGHGQHGHLVSQEALRKMHFELDRSSELSQNPEGVLTAAFHAVQEHLRELGSKPDPLVPARESGACALVAHIAHGLITVAGAGDCRAVLATNTSGTIELSVDHKVDLPAEQARIEAKGGSVMPAQGSDVEGDFCPARVYDSRDHSLGPGLTMSRVLGDTDAEECGVIPTPEVRKHTISADDRFLILASDGVWEFVDSDEAVRIVDKVYSAGEPAKAASRELIIRSAIRWAQMEGCYRDDITAIVIYVHEATAALLRPSSSSSSSF